MTERPKAFASSSNGDCWRLQQDEAADPPYVLHVANPASGGAETRFSVGDFLSQQPQHPQHVALLQVIGSLVDQTHDRSTLQKPY